MWEILLYILFVASLFIFYWKFAAHKAGLQNSLLLLTSIIFYIYLDWRFASLLLVQTLATFFLAKCHNKTGRRSCITFGVITNLGALAFFKYFNFFYENIQQALHINANLFLSVALPVGISFYTFRLVGYLLDLKNTKVQVEEKLINFGLFAIFFPTIIMGPIDNPKALLSQFKKSREFKYDTAVEGLRQILYGIFTKYVVGNNIAGYTSDIFDHYEGQSGATLLVALFLYFVQLYADFAGYSNIAVGIGRLFGIEIARNFNYPIFAQNIADFWRKWHMSLTTWFTNHLFMPLVIFFRNYGKLGLVAAIVINFAIIGMWHGASWTFLLFGILHGLFYVPLIFFGNINKQYNLKKLDAISWKWVANVILTTLLFCLSLTFFIAKDMKMAFGIYRQIFSVTLFSAPVLKIKLLCFCALVYVAEFYARKKEFPLDFKNERPLLRHAVYVAVLILIIIYGLFNGNQFIYQQF